MQRILATRQRVLPSSCFHRGICFFQSLPCVKGGGVFARKRRRDCNLIFLFSSFCFGFLCSTIPQSPSVTAPFTQGSLSYNTSYVRPLFASTHRQQPLLNHAKRRATYRVVFCHKKSVVLWHNALSLYFNVIFLKLCTKIVRKVA